MVQPLIFEAFHGMTVSCFAYGQTGSGKTYTMLGDENNNGIKFLAILDIYKFLPQF
jgi:kinesin family protein 2/24